MWATNSALAAIPYLRDIATSASSTCKVAWFNCWRGKQFAWVMGSTLYLRAGDATRAEFEAHGAEPFSYSTKKGLVLVRKFYTAPEFLMDDAEQLIAWARKAIVAASA